MFSSTVFSIFHLFLISLFVSISSDCKPLWPFEDITPRNTTVKSAEQLKIFLRMVISIFEEAVPHAHLLERWGYEALHWATSCSSRHYAGRSFQMFRGLHTPLTWTMLSDVLQRLVESVADSSDDVQVWYSISSTHFVFLPKEGVYERLFNGGRCVQL